MECDSSTDTGDHKGVGFSETLGCENTSFASLPPECCIDQGQSWTLVPNPALPEEINSGAGPGEGDWGFNPPDSPACPRSPRSPIGLFASKDEKEKQSDDEEEQRQQEDEEIPIVFNYKPRVLEWPVSEQACRPTVSKPPAFCSAKYRPMPTGVGPGLRNLGYTCFLNATMQCLTHTVPFVQGLAEAEHPNPCGRAMDGFCVFCALRDHMSRAMCSSGGVIAPIKLVENINCIGPYFEEGQQEDAHEFQHALLDRLESCCYSDQAVDGNTPAESNMVDQVFGGRLVSEVCCCECGHRTRTFETFIDLSLEIERADTLHAALECFTDVEKMDDFRCENCNQKVNIEKHFLLERKPMIAALHLKRFKSDGFNVEKIDKHVGFPLELDLQPFSSGSKNGNMELKYYLYAVVVHAGISPTSGHYFSFIRSSPNTWHGFDDSRVCEVSQEDVLSESAYILFYAREDVPWFSSIMEKPKQGLDMKDGSPTSVLDIANVATSPPVQENKPIYSVMEASAPLLCSVSSFEKGNIGKSNDTAEQRDVDSLGDELMLDDQSTTEASNVFDGTSCSNAKGVEPSFSRGNIGNRENNHGKLDMFEPSSSGGNIDIDNKENDQGKLDMFLPLTPIKPHSPEYANVPGGKLSGVNSGTLNTDVKRNHLSCKRQLNKELLDPKRREAIRNIKGMPNARAALLLPLLCNPRGPNKKAKRTLRESQCKSATTPSSSQKSLVPGRIH